MWKGAPGNLVASGRLGIYTIQTVGAAFILQGIGPDNKVLANLGPLGQQFSTIEAAKSYAQEHDQT